MDFEYTETASDWRTHTIQMPPEEVGYYIFPGGVIRIPLYKRPHLLGRLFCRLLLDWRYEDA